MMVATSFVREADLKKKLKILEMKTEKEKLENWTITQSCTRFVGQND